MKCNETLRQYAREKNVFLWQLAEAIGVSEPTLMRKLRRELPDAEAKRWMKAVDEIATAEAEEVSENA